MSLNMVVERLGLRAMQKEGWINVPWMIRKGKEYLEE